MSRIAAAVLAVLLFAVPALAQAKPVVTEQTLRFDDATLKLHVRYSYPSIKIPGALMGMSANAREFNQLMRTKAQAAKEAFVKQVRRSPGPAGAPGRNELSAKYTIEANDGRLIAVKTVTFANLVGSAHPTTTVSTVNFDLSGKPLALEDLFKAGTPWLQTIASEVGTQIRASAKKSNTPVFEDGLEPVQKNFEQFIVRPDALVIYLNPYQVTPGYLGVRKVSIPWRYLRPLMSQEAVWVIAATPAKPKSAALWTENFPAAQARAKAENKRLLLDFTGSDWCGWCIKLDKEVFATAEFKKYAAENLVLVKVDFPQAIKQSAALKKQNEALQNKYKIEGYPTLIILSPEGKKLGETGYQPGGPQALIQELEKIK